MGPVELATDALAFSAASEEAADFGCDVPEGKPGICARADCPSRPATIATPASTRRPPLPRRNSFIINELREATMTQALRKPPAQRRRQVPYGSFPFRWGPLQQIARPRQIAARGRATLLYYTNRKLVDDNEFRQETGGEIDHLILTIYYVH